MALVNCKCTSCGAILKVDHRNQVAICEYCKSAYIVEDAINNYNIVNNNNISNSVVNIFENNNQNISTKEKVWKFLNVLDIENAKKHFKEIYAENPDDPEILFLKEGISFGEMIVFNSVRLLKNYYINNKNITKYEENCIKFKGKEPLDYHGWSSLSDVLGLLLDLKDYERLKEYGKYVNFNINPQKLLNRNIDDIKVFFSCDLNKTFNPYQKLIHKNYNNDSYKEYIHYYSEFSFYDAVFVRKDICELIEKYYPNSEELNNKIRKETLIRNQRCICCGKLLGFFKSNYINYRGKKINFFNSKGCNNTMCVLYHEFQDDFYDPFYIK